MTPTADARPATVVDMSPDAIERRLAQVGALYPLMLSLRRAAVEAPPAAAVVPGASGPSGSRR